jgi:hypothetical protein
MRYITQINVRLFLPLIPLVPYRDRDGLDDCADSQPI